MLSGATPSVSARCTRLATTVSAVLNVVSICCDSDSARLALAIVALRRLASRTCHICQLSMPTSAADRNSAKMIVQLSQRPRGSSREDEDTDDGAVSNKVMTQQCYAQEAIGRLKPVR